jgi:phage tail sheath protein FI
MASVGVAHTESSALPLDHFERVPPIVMTGHLGVRSAEDGAQPTSRRAVATGSPAWTPPSQRNMVMADLLPKEGGAMSTPLEQRVSAAEIPGRRRPIEGAKASVAAFVGLAPGGPFRRPIRASTWTQFAKIYSDPNEAERGPFMPGAYMAYAVRGFFENGGRVCWIVRVGPGSKTPRRVGRDDKGDWPNSDLAAGLREGIGDLSGISEITIVCSPDIMALAEGSDNALLPDHQGSLVAHCEAAGNRMAILDAPPALQPQEMLGWRTKEGAYDSNSAALYYPWIEVLDPQSNQPTAVPPSGHVAGIWARTDVTRGVWKAPTDAVVLDAGGVTSAITDDEQGALNGADINCIRSFPGRGIRVWGARTLSSDPEWRYLNIRRLVTYIRQSIMEGTRWAVFEPNDETLWRSIRRDVGAFLTRTWSEGALFGSSPEQGFYVKCDEETNTPEVVEAGQVVMEIGIAPVRPAEFVSIRVSQLTATAKDPSAGAPISSPENIRSNPSEIG